MRIDKLLSDLGLASRKESSRVARSGGITVDGAVVQDTSKHVDPKQNKLTYLGRAVTYQRFTYVMLNKPEGYVSATDDKKLPYVTELLPEELRRRDLFPVGRLDRDTVGLMILTNNGQLAHTVLSPKHHVAKKYYFRSADPLPQGTEERFKDRIVLADGYECKEAILELSQERDSGYITLTEGKYHQIKRMIAASGSRVTYLERVEFAGIELDCALERGEWRYLTDGEISALMKTN